MSKTKEVTFENVRKASGDKLLYAFGGMVAGKAASHLLDKAITSQPVQGLLGIEMSQNVSKYAKPIIITTAGAIGAFKSKNENMKFASIGFGAMGIGDLSNVILGKDYLSGIDGINGFGNNDDFEIIDLENSHAIPAAPALNLPVLTGDTGMTNSESYQEYAENVEYADFELEDA
jgi:hypothetical protein